MSGFVDRIAEPDIVFVGLLQSVDAPCYLHFFVGLTGLLDPLCFPKLLSVMAFEVHGGNAAVKHNSDFVRDLVPALGRLTGEQGRSAPRFGMMDEVF